MLEQHLTKLSRYARVFHFVLLDIILAPTIVSIVNLDSAFGKGSGQLHGVMPFLVSITLTITFFKIQCFPLPHRIGSSGPKRISSIFLLQVNNELAPVAVPDYDPGFRF